jgi:bifunctional non-homologous end joining protein LigD
MTGDGRLRHAVYHGLREDKPARTVRLEEDRMPDDTRVDIAGISVSSPNRIVYPDAGITKGDVAAYYEAIADRLLDTAADRPLSLVRLPEGLEGERFFQKHRGKGFPDDLKPVEVTESGGAAAEYMYVSTAAGLVGAAQMGTLEFHIWGARRDRLERPDRMVFDLDPDEGLGFADVVAAATEIRDRLEALGLPAWPLVTGGKGVHIIVPLRRIAGWETVKLYSRIFATLLAEEEPKRFTATMSKAKRKGRIFIDWLRNERGATAIAPFSLRARPGAPAAVPVSWKELAKLESADSFKLKDALKRDWSALELPAPVGLTEARIEALQKLGSS